MKLSNLDAHYTYCTIYWSCRHRLVQYVSQLHQRLLLTPSIFSQCIVTTCSCTHLTRVRACFHGHAFRAKLKAISEAAQNKGSSLSRSTMESPQNPCSTEEGVIWLGRFIFVMFTSFLAAGIVGVACWVGMPEIWALAP